MPPVASCRFCARRPRRRVDAGAERGGGALARSGAARGRRRLLGTGACVRGSERGASARLRTWLGAGARALAPNAAPRKTARVAAARRRARFGAAVAAIPRVRRSHLRGRARARVCRGRVAARVSTAPRFVVSARLPGSERSAMRPARHAGIPGRGCAPHLESCPGQPWAALQQPPRRWARTTARCVRSGRPSGGEARPERPRGSWRRWPLRRCASRRYEGVGHWGSADPHRPASGCRAAARSRNRPASA